MIGWGRSPIASFPRTTCDGHRVVRLSGVALSPALHCPVVDRAFVSRSVPASCAGTCFTGIARGVKTPRQTLPKDHDD